MFWLFWSAAVVLVWIGTVHSVFTAIQAAMLTIVPTAALLILQRRRRG
jgi:hypothetical protein